MTISVWEDVGVMRACIGRATRKMGRAIVERMGWLARVVVTSATLLGGCAALAGIGDSNPVEENGEGGSSGSGSMLPPNDAASTDGAKADGAPTCGANEAACTSSTGCCGKCNEQKLCKSSCKPIADSCNPSSTDECCLGAYCHFLNFAVRCVACITAGQRAELDWSGQAIDRSCCSRTTGNNDICN